MQDKIQEQPLLGETATAYNDFFSYYGKRFERYNEDQLRQRKGYQIYEEMLRDPQVKASFNVVLDLIASRQYRFEKSLLDDEMQERVIDLFNYNIESFLKESFTQALRKILMAKAYGFSICEKNYASVEYDNQQRWLLNSLKLRPWNTFTFEVDEYGNILSILQQQKGGSNKKLNPSKFIIYINQPELDENYGESDLRSVYRAYWIKDNVIKFWNIWVERLAGGFIVAQADKDAAPLTPVNKAQLDDVLQNITKSTSIRMPAGYQLDIKNPVSTKAFEEAVAYCDRQISRGLLVPELAGYTEQGNTGSFSQAKVQQDIFYNVIENQAKQLEEVLNEQLFKELAYWNFGVKDFPKFRFEKYTDEEKREIAKAWIEASEKGVVINTEQDENRTRELLQYDSRDDDQEPISKEEGNPSAEKGKEDQEANDEVAQGNELPDQTEEVNQSEQIVFADEDEDVPPYEARVNFTELESQLNALEEDYFLAITDITQEIYQDLIDIGKETLAEKDAKENPDKYLNKKDEEYITPSRKKDLRKEFIKQLNKGYRLGRSTAKDEIEKALKQIPDRRLSEQKIKSLAFLRKVAVKFTPSESFGALNFVDNVDIDQYEKFINAQSFYLTGDISADMLAKFKAILEKAILNEWDIDTFVVELGDVMRPYLRELGFPEERLESRKGAVAGELTMGTSIEIRAKTTLANTFNQAQLSVFTDPELSDFVEALQYSAILDRRTSKFCNSYHGRIFMIDDPIWNDILPANHFRCRSRTVAVTVIDKPYKTDKPAEDSKGNLIQPASGFGIVK